jgi:hypothetical protein
VITTVTTAGTQASPAWRALVPRPVATEADAATFVAALGFCTWGPVPGVAFPNLAEQMGESGYSVLFHTWFWKDDLHFERQLYYAKVVRGQPTFISPEYLPDIIAALAGRGHERERDVAALFQEGRLSRQARLIYDYLEKHPAQPTRDLRRGTGLFSADLSAATEKALAELQCRFLVCKVGLTGRTRGTYSYVWDLAERFCPDAFTEAARTSLSAARARIRGRLGDFGIESSPALEQRLFLWRP